MNSCSFFGHRTTVVSNETKQKIKNVIENLIKIENYEIFYFGEFGDFDDVCYEIVSEIKLTYPNIKRVYVATNDKALLKHKRICIKTYEEQITLPLTFEWWYQIIYYRNLAIIDNSNFVVFYVENEQNSGANKALRYAIKTKKQHINLAISPNTIKSI